MATTGIWSIDRVYNKQLSGQWVTSAYSPPVEAVWFGGGVSQSMVDRVTVSTDTNTATVRGPLSAASRYIRATGNSTYGWFAAANTNPSRVERITFSTDTAATSIRGPLAAGGYLLVAMTAQTASYLGGGYDGGLYRTSVNRITHATDTATATLVGSFPTNVQSGAAVSDTTTYGWANQGAAAPTLTQVTTIYRITYASDTTLATTRGPLSTPRSRLAASFNTSYGWFAAGATPAQVSSIDRLTYATDTAATTTRGPLAQNRIDHAAGGTQSVGYFGGGYIPPGTTSVVSKITYATDTNTSVNVGPRAITSRQLGGTSGMY